MKDQNLEPANISEEKKSKHNASMATADLWKKIMEMDVSKEHPKKTADKEKEQEEKNEKADRKKQQTDSKKPENISNKRDDLSEENESDDAESEKEDADEMQESFDKMSKSELAGQLEEIVKEENLSRIKTKVALIKVAYLKQKKEDEHTRLKSFIEDGGNEAEFVYELDNDDVKFNKAFSVYKDKRSALLQKQEEQKLINLEEKKKILEELKELINSEETLKKTYDDFKFLQDRWKQIGQIPKGEVNALWQNYHFLVEKFFDKVKINKELKDLDLKKNLEAKISLCEKAEELLLDTSIINSFRKLQEYHNEWKEVGPVPQDKKDEIWDRFKNTTDKINQRRREHYQKMKTEQESNLVAKTALCEKAEEIVGREIETVKDWQQATNDINELLTVWKTIGRAPKKENDEIWARFKTYLDTFFSNKKEYFNEIKEHQVENYNLKLDLCVQAEAMKDSSDWRRTTEQLIYLQKEWKKIGPVPRKYSDDIWKRFRAACDEFFNAKAAYYSNIKEHEAENLSLKQELIDKVEKYEFSDNKEENLESLKDFQRQWMEIGHVPIKEKDNVQKIFRKLIDEKLEALKISAVEINTLNYKTKIATLKDNPDANRIIFKERNQINNRIKNLRDDINLWENNIGFLADSKKANVLKEEFEKKINKAKEDLVVLEAKMKMIREMEKKA